MTVNWVLLGVATLVKSCDVRVSSAAPALTPVMVTCLLSSPSANSIVDGETVNASVTDDATLIVTGLPGLPEHLTVAINEPVAPRVGCVASY